MALGDKRPVVMGADIGQSGGPAAFEHTHTAADVGAAPAGYGLGTAAKLLDSLDDASADGFYYANKGGPSSGWWFGTCKISSNHLSRVLTVYQIASNGVWYKAERQYYGDSGWSPWEWVNPPMALGVEYRTIERYLGKPVYVKAVNYGAMPNASRKNVAHGITNLSACIDIYGSHNQWNFGVPEIDFLYANETNINMKTNSDCSAYTATVVMKYTKTTD